MSTMITLSLDGTPIDVEALGYFAPTTPPTFFTSAPLTADELQVVRAAIRKAGPFRPNQCYANAAKLAMRDRTGLIQYAEGDAGFPLSHAFNVINGKVVDLTRSGSGKVRHLKNRVVGEFGGYYRGVVVPVVVVERLAMQRGEWDATLHPDTRWNWSWPD